MAFLAPEDELEPVAAPVQTGFSAPESDVRAAVSDLVDDNDFDPVSYAIQTGDEDTAAEVAWRKHKKPITADRAMNVAGKFFSAIPEMVSNFGEGLGNVAVDTYAISQAPDSDFWKNQGIDPQTASTLIERAKTQQMARAQLIENNTRGFAEKLTSQNGPLGGVGRSLAGGLLTMGQYVPGISEASKTALTGLEEEKKDRDVNPREYFVQRFRDSVARARKGQEIESGKIQNDGVVAGTLGAINSALGGGDYKASEEFATPEQLAAANAPVDPDAIRTGAVAGDPINLLPLGIPRAAPVFNKAAGAALRGAALPARAVAKTLEVAGNVAKKSPGRVGAIARGTATLAGAHQVLNNPEEAAKLLGLAAGAYVTYKGARLVGHVLDTAGKKLIDPKFVTNAERAAAKEVIEQGARPFSKAQNVADLERVATRVVGGAAAAPIAMAPLNAAISETPEEFAQLEGGLVGFGGLGGITSYNPARGYRNETVQAVNTVLRETGAKKQYGTPLDAAHQAFTQNLAPEVQDAVNSYRGFFDGFKTRNGGEYQIYVLPGDVFANEVSTRDPSVSPSLARQQRGYKGADNVVLVNGDIPQQSADTLGHEAGGHVAQTILETIAPDLAQRHQEAFFKGLIDQSGVPTPELKKFVDAYNRAFDPTGQRLEIQTNDRAISEWMAEQARAALAGEGPAKFAAGESVRQKILDNIGDYLKQTFDVPRDFDRAEVPALAREYRDLLYNLNDLRGDTPVPAPTNQPPTTPPAQQPNPAPTSPATATSPTSGTATPAAPNSASATQPSAPVNQPAAPTVTPPVAPTQSAPPAQPTPATTPSAPAITTPSTQSAPPPQSSAQATPTSTGSEVPAWMRPGAQIPPPPPSIPIDPTAPMPGPTRRPSMVDFEPPVAVVEPPPSFDPNGQTQPTNQTPPASRVSRTPEPLPDSNANTGTTEVPAPSAEAIAEALRRGEEAGLAKPARKAEKRAENVRAARLNALREMIPPASRGLKVTQDPVTGDPIYQGDIDPANPLHSAILGELGYTPEQVSNLLAAQQNNGKGVWLRDYNHAAQEGFDTGDGLDFSGEKRGQEYRASQTGSAGQRRGEVTKADKPFTPFQTILTEKGVVIRGFDQDKFLNNVREIIDFAGSNDVNTGLGDVKGKARDKAITEAFRKVSENHKNGWKGDGSAPLKVFPDTGITQNLDYVGQPVNADLANLINMAMNIASAKPPTVPRGGTERAQKKFSEAQRKAKEAQGLAQLNNGFLNPATGETNSLRNSLEALGFNAGKRLKPTISNIRPDLIEGGISDTPSSGRSVHAHGFDVNPADFTLSGTPQGKIVSAGFMPSSPINTEGFRNWFKDSKITNPDGTPAVVYHGTDKAFNKFSTKKTPGGISWFSSSKDAVSDGRAGARGSSKIMELYASIQNPAGWKEYNNLTLDEIKGRGFDGVILTNSDGSYDGFVFDPQKLKSATKNSGAFDPSNPDIRFMPSTGETPSSKTFIGAEISGFALPPKDDRKKPQMSDFQP